MYCGYTHTHTPCLYTQQPRPITSIFFCCFHLRLFLKVLDMLALNVLAPTSRSSIGQDERETHRKDALMRHSLLYIKPKKSSWKGGGGNKEWLLWLQSPWPLYSLIIWVIYKYIQHLELYRHIVCAYIYSDSVENSMTTHSIAISFYTSTFAIDSFVFWVFYTGRRHNSQDKWMREL